jgi:hypothetical protein
VPGERTHEGGYGQLPKRKISCEKYTQINPTVDAFFFPRQVFGSVRSDSFQRHVPGAFFLLHKVIFSSPLYFIFSGRVLLDRPGWSLNSQSYLSLPSARIIPSSQSIVYVSNESLGSLAMFWDSGHLEGNTSFYMLVRVVLNNINFF